MNYQNELLPEGIVLAGETPVLTNETVPKGILARHMAPRGKIGFLQVLEGALQFVWEDSLETFDADKDHPIVIEPERFHHVQLTRPVRFKVQFYTIPGMCAPDTSEADAERPGERYVGKDD